MCQLVYMFQPSGRSTGAFFRTGEIGEWQKGEPRGFKKGKVTTNTRRKVCGVSAAIHTGTQGNLWKEKRQYTAF